MFSGIFLAVLTNLCWTVFGAVLSFTARGQGRLPALFALIFAGGLPEFACPVRDQPRHETGAQQHHLGRLHNEVPTE